MRGNLFTFVRGESFNNLRRTDASCAIDSPFMSALAAPILEGFKQLGESDDESDESE